MEQKVFVVTNPELGWDCVVGVYSTREKAQRVIDDPQMDIIHEQIVDDELDNE